MPLASNDVEYEVAILAQGCYPKYSTPLPLDFYSAHARISIHKDVTGLRDVVEGVKLEVEPLSEKELNQLSEEYKPSYRVPPVCRNEPREKEKLAPYLPN